MLHLAVSDCVSVFPPLINITTVVSAIYPNEEMCGKLLSPNGGRLCHTVRRRTTTASKHSPLIHAYVQKLFRQSQSLEASLYIEVKSIMHSHRMPDSPSHRSMPTDTYMVITQR